jgi:hypothetical protein
MQWNVGSELTTRLNAMVRSMLHVVLNGQRRHGAGIVRRGLLSHPFHNILPKSSCCGYHWTQCYNLRSKFIVTVHQLTIALAACHLINDMYGCVRMIRVLA